MRLVREGRGRWAEPGPGGAVGLPGLGVPAGERKEGGRAVGAGPAPSTGLGEKPRRTRPGPAGGVGTGGRVGPPAWFRLCPLFRESQRPWLLPWHFVGHENTPYMWSLALKSK